jgi:1-acyl-sn-glycerol-3-phosphate acyltransferase
MVQSADAADSSRMWLLPALSRVASMAIRSVYRFDVEGEAPPATGPVLFVANHPNSLVDPAFVAAAAGRPVRFLAKAPLFTDRLVGWLIRASGAIPVYRRKDDPALMDANQGMFEAVHAALGGGWAVGIFPEGISHSAPEIAVLRTGAARIGLGAALRLGSTFPIVPIGMVLREKGRFRSEAAAIIGAPVEWADLRGRSETDAEAVRDLTARIGDALRGVTINVERWEDLPTVECAEAIYAAELDLGRGREDRVRRMRQVSETLNRYRAEEPERIDSLYRAVERFRRSLEQLGLSADDLDAAPDRASVVGWVVRRLLLFLVTGPVAAAGAVIFFVPYRLTHWIASQSGLDPDVRATWKILGGAVSYLVWILLLAVVAGLALGGSAAVAAFILLPVVAVTTSAVRDSWTDARLDVRRYVNQRGTSHTIERLREHRRVLAESLEAMRREVR